MRVGAFGVFATRLLLEVADEAGEEFCTVLSRMREDWRIGLRSYAGP
jgi:hypothetical protein